MRKIISTVIFIGLILSCSNDESSNSSKKIYLFKRNFENFYSQEVSLVQYNFDNSSESLIFNLGNDFDSDNFSSIEGKVNTIFHPSKNEIITLDKSNYSLVGVNLDSGIEKKYNLNPGYYNGLIITNTEDIYLFKKNPFNPQQEESFSLIKYDIDNSSETLIYNLGNIFNNNVNIGSYDGINAIFHPSKNEIIILKTGDYTNTGEISLLRVNLTDGSEMKHILNIGNSNKYNGLTITNSEDIYLFKRKFENNNYQTTLIKYDLDNWTETLIYNLGNDFDQNSSISSYGAINVAYDQNNNEIIILDTGKSTILKVNLTNGTESKYILNAVGNHVNYNSLIIK